MKVLYNGKSGASAAGTSVRKERETIMTHIIYFDYAALSILAVILFSALYRRVGFANGNSAFLICTAELLFGAIVNICAATADASATASAGLRILLHSVRMLSHTLFPFFYLIYLFSLTESWHRLRQDTRFHPFLLFPAVCCILLFLLNSLGLIDVFHLDDALAYCQGRVYFSVYACSGLYALFSIAHVYRNRELLRIRWCFTLLSPYLFLLGAAAVHLFSPVLIVDVFFAALSLLFIYTNIQKPEEFRDPVTGLGNMNAFEERCRRIYFNSNPVRVLVLDLQSISAIREMLDYGSRRVFLRILSEHIEFAAKRHGVRLDCYSGRQGRFFLIGNEKDADHMRDLSQELLDYFNRSQYFQSSELRMETAACLISVPEDIPDFADFMRYVSSDLKELSCGSVHEASELLRERYFRILLNVNRIVTDALRYNRFEVYYQPIYSCRLKRFVSAEALLRLKDPEFGFVSPEVFIPAAERIGAIRQIGDLVLKNVCEFIGSPSFRELGLDYVEVNLSALECIQDDLPDRVFRAIREAEITANRLALEVTESALIYNPDKLKENLNKLAEAGIILCLDDFGTGYSDTRRIIDLPLSIVKLDRNFLTGIERKFNQVLIRDTVKMINDVGNQVVAEGVETEAAMILLESFGCDMIQGFYFSKPLPRKDFETLCLSRKVR